MNNGVDLFMNLLIPAIILIIPVLFIIGISQNWSLVPQPKERDFNPMLAEWAQQRGLRYTPQ